MSCLKDTAHCMMQRTLCASTHSWKLEAELYRCHMNTVQIVVIMPKCAACLACLVCLAWRAFHSCITSVKEKTVAQQFLLQGKHAPGTTWYSGIGTYSCNQSMRNHTTHYTGRVQATLVTGAAFSRLVPWLVPVANQPYQVHCGSGCLPTWFPFIAGANG